MSYAETLERLKKLEDAPEGEVPKVTKGGFGTFVTPDPGASQQFRASFTSGRCHLNRLSRPPTADRENSQTARGGTAKSDRRLVPLVRCPDCHHFEPDRLNPAQGIGRCRIGAASDPADRDYQRAPQGNQFKLTTRSRAEISARILWSERPARWTGDQTPKSSAIRASALCFAYRKRHKANHTNNYRPPGQPIYLR